MTVSFIGGDARMLRCAHRFREMGATVTPFTAEMPLFPDVVILPLPVTRDGIHPTATDKGAPTFSDIFAALPRGALVLGGMIPPSLFAAAEAAGVRLVDYYRDEELLTRNAYTTAEAAVGMAMLDLPVTLRGTPLAVVGSGRIARALCALLLAIGARVDVYARNPVALASLVCRGGNPHLFGAAMPLALQGDARAVFATVPAPVLDDVALSDLAPNTPIYDLWGGGVCCEGKKKASLSLPDCRALPGRYSPESAADDLFAAILRTMEKEVKTR